MASLNDQYNMARIPLKPLAYENRTKSQNNEFMIDYGDDGTYHMYITHHSDRTKYIDLTNVIIKEIGEGISISGDDITVSIEGIKEPQALGDILNSLWKNYLFPDDASGFDVNEDLDKLFDDSTKSILLTDTSGTIYLPITTADNVFDEYGKSVQARLDEMTRMAFSMDYIYATTDNQTSFEFTYPFPNYGDFMEVRVGTTYVDKTRYQVIEETADDGNIYGGTITFIDESVEIARRIDLLFIYNAAATTSLDSYGYTSGTYIANNTIASSKLQKTSDSYTLNDSTSIATSAAVYNLYMALTDMIEEDNSNIAWYLDTYDGSAAIKIGAVNEDIKSYDYFFLNIITACAKGSECKLTFNYGTSYSMNVYIYNLDGTICTNTLPANKPLKLLWIKDEGKFFMLSSTNSAIRKTRKFYRCTDQETEISYNGLEYDSSSVIDVYRNGVRLFEDYDYSIDTANETITLFVRTELTEMIVFEALTVNT